MREGQDNEGVSPRREVPDATDVDDGIGVDPLGDADDLSQNQAKKNFAKVGSARPTTLLYTYGPGAIIDLPHFTIMPTGLDDWERIWHRRAADPVTVHAPASWRRFSSCSATQVGRAAGVFPGSRRGPAFAVTATISACRAGLPPVAALHRLRPSSAAEPFRRRLHQYPSLPPRSGNLQTHQLPWAFNPREWTSKAQEHGQTEKTTFPLCSSPLSHCLSQRTP